MSNKSDRRNSADPNMDLSDPIRQLIERLDADQQEESPKLWYSISQLIDFKKRKYRNILFDEKSNKGLIVDLENAQDKYISSLCNFGQTKEDIIYILSNDPMNIHTVSLPKLTPLTQQTITDLENNIGLSLRIINQFNAMDGTKIALASALNMDLDIPRKFNVKSASIWKSGAQDLPFDGEEAQMKWLQMDQQNKMAFIKEVTNFTSGPPSQNNPFVEYVKAGTNMTQLSKLAEFYSIVLAKMRKVDQQLSKHKKDLQKDNKWDKISKYAAAETQCDGKPAFFGEQSSSDIWQYLRTENAEFFSLLSRYNTIKDILNKIDVIEKQVNNPDGQIEYYNRLKRSIIDFDLSVKGTARLDLKEWLRDEVFSFIALWRVFRKKHLNMSLLGPPGSGKTTIAQSLGPILSNLGILILGRYQTVSRSDLVDQYVGGTANKVKSILDSMLESVLFIDEAYAVACSSPVLPGFENQIKFDEFGIEGINEIVNYLDKNSGSIMVIAAGYERDMKHCFFGANVGLTRRFPNQYILKDMPSNDLLKIFESVLKSTIGDQDLNNILSGSAQACIENLLTQTAGYWTNQAGDMVNLAEIVASKRAAKGRPLAPIELHDIIASLFTQKDLSRMRNIPESVENQMVRNWDQNRVSDFFDNLDFLQGEQFANEKSQLKGIFNTGAKLSTITPEKADFLPSGIKFSLLDAVEEEKGEGQRRVKSYFEEQNKQFCASGASGASDDSLPEAEGPLSNLISRQEEDPREPQRRALPRRNAAPVEFTSQARQRKRRR